MNMVFLLPAGSLPTARYSASIFLAVMAENSSVELILIQCASTSAVMRRAFGPKAET
jgi:hypothetical protein